MQTREDLAATGVRGELGWAAAGLVVMTVAALACTAAFRSGRIADPVAQSVWSYAAVWIPLIAALFIACSGRGWAGTRRLLGLRFHILDVPWGLAGGLFARAIDAFSRLQLTGSTGLAPQPVLGTPTMTGWVIVLGIVVPVIIAPVIEEVFFRGLLQRSLAQMLAGSRRSAASAIAVLATSVLFATAHVVLAEAIGIQAVEVAVGTFAFSVIAGTIAATTGRIGGAVVAHIVFNAVAVMMVGPW